MMTDINRPKPEYGGFLPLELNPGEEYFSQYGEDNLYRFNSVKAALDMLIRELDTDEIFLPYYYCPSTTVAIKNTGIKVSFYHIDESLLPESIPDKVNTTVLLVDYFGVCGEAITKLARTFSKSEVIIDRAHDFFEKPVMSEHIHNVYSARKFFGVPDGAYLVSSDRITGYASYSFSNGYADYLFKSYEEGTNAAYLIKKDADTVLGENYGPMSVLSNGLLRNADYERVRSQRSENYKVLYELLGDLNELSIPEEKPAYLFPFLNTRRGSIIKRRLVEEHIYVPTLWAGPDLTEFGNKYELNMKDNAVFLPVDQRYDTSDMSYIANRVKKIIEE